MGQYVYISRDVSAMIFTGDSETEFKLPHEKMNRSRRAEALQECDWTQANDSPLSIEDQQKYRVYRQALRDLTKHENWPQIQQEDWPTLEISK